MMGPATLRRGEGKLHGGSIQNFTRPLSQWLGHREPQEGWFNRVAAELRRRAQSERCFWGDRGARLPSHLPAPSGLSAGLCSEPSPPARAGCGRCTGLHREGLSNPSWDTTAKCVCGGGRIPGLAKKAFASRPRAPGVPERQGRVGAGCCGAVREPALGEEHCLVALAARGLLRAWREPA